MTKKQNPEEIYKAETLPLSKIDLNTGQISGVPKNPRKISDEKMNWLREKLRKRPNFIYMNRPKVIEHEGRFVAISGNQRITAMGLNGSKKVPVWILPKDTETEELKELAILDNEHAGEYDYELLVSDDWGDAIDDYDIDIFDPEEDVDYSDLEALNDDGKMQDLEKGVKKGVLIDFSPDQYPEAIALMKHFRDKGVDLGEEVLKWLRELKKSEEG